MVHFIGIKRAWANHRLIPSAICTVLGMVHFCYVISLAPTRYPVIKVASSVFELLLVSLITFTFLLNVASQLLLDGVVTRVAVGHTSFIRPREDEDFSVVLIRVGGACLEATSIVGLGNELSGVALPSPPQTRPSQYGEIQLGSSGMMSMIPGEDIQGPRSGFTNEVRTVKVAGSKQNQLLQSVYADEIKQLARVSWRFFVGFWIMVWRFMKREQVFPTPVLASRRTPARDASQELPVVQTRGTGEYYDGDGSAEAYRRFLAGETFSDGEDDDDFVPRAGSLEPDGEDDDNDVPELE